MKKILSIIMAIGMSVSVCASSFANETMLISEDVNLEVSTEDTHVTYDKTKISGVVKNIEEDTLIIEYDENMFGIMFDENTCFTTQDGLPIVVGDIKAGDNVNAVVSTMTTRSLPPKAYGYVVTVANDNEALLPIYVEVGEVENKEDNTTVIYSADGEYVVTLSNESQISPLKSRNILSRTDLIKGSCILVYSDMMTMSIPALLNPSKVVVLSIPVETFEDEVAAETEEMIYDKGNMAGIVTDISSDEIALDVNGSEWIVKYDENSVFTNQDAEPVLSTDIVKGDNLSVVISNAATLSLPPQTYGYVFSLVNDVTKPAPIYMEVKDVAHSNSDSIKLVSACGNYETILSSSTQVIPFRTRNIISANDITVGSKVIVLSDMMTMSIPAILNPSKVVVLSLGEINNDEAENKEVLRADFAKMIFDRLASFGKVDEETYEKLVKVFDDVEDNFSKEIAYLNKIGLLKGKTEAHFFPNDMVTREEVAVVLDRIAQNFSSKIAMNRAYVEPFGDEDEIAPWAKNPAYHSMYFGLNSKDGKFLPKSGLSKAEIDGCLDMMFTSVE